VVRSIIFQAMATEETPKQNTTEEEPNVPFQLGAVIHAFSEEDFRTLVNETIKVQQASLNVMKMIAKAVC
jgi:hypothetical protein